MWPSKAALSSSAIALFDESRSTINPRIVLAMKLFFVRGFDDESRCGAWAQCSSAEKLSLARSKQEALQTSDVSKYLRRTRGRECRSREAFSEYTRQRLEPLIWGKQASNVSPTVKTDEENSFRCD